MSSIDILRTIHAMAAERHQREIARQEENESPIIDISDIDDDLHDYQNDPLLRYLLSLDFICFRGRSI